MNRGAKTLLEKFTTDVNLDKKSFELGVLALKSEIQEFINGQLKGERTCKFSLGQDDGLRWVNDHLNFLFEKDF